MTSPLFAILGTTGRTATLSYRFFDINGDWVGSAITAGIFEQDANKGTYGVAAATIPPTSRGVHWQDSGIASLQADEIFPATGYATDVDALLAAGTGPFPITVTVTDGTDPLQNATVALYDGSSLAGRLVTDINGNATFGLALGTYQVALFKGGYMFAPENRTVTGNQTGTLINDLVMTATGSVTPPVDPDLCRLYGYLVLITGQPAVNVDVQVRLVANRASEVAGSVVERSSQTTQTDGTGYFEIDLIKTDTIDPSPTYEIKCLPAKIELVNVELTTSTQDIAALLP